MRSSRFYRSSLVGPCGRPGSTGPLLVGPCGRPGSTGPLFVGSCGHVVCTGRRWSGPVVVRDRQVAQTPATQTPEHHSKFEGCSVAGVAGAWTTCGCRFESFGCMGYSLLGWKGAFSYIVVFRNGLSHKRRGALDVGNTSHLDLPTTSYEKAPFHPSIHDEHPGRVFGF